MSKRQKTFTLKPEEVQRRWWIIDLEGKTLGRAATKIADILRGKNRATYTPNVDGGDFVVAINAGKINLTGKKWDDKIYYRHTGFPGGIKQHTAKELQVRHPEAILTKAVKGMLPKNFLADKLIQKLKVYEGVEHPHAAPNPTPLK
ncbi:MAG: 50S ribosomal protein L13 [Deltaproteobacteria bacterium RIFCSPLOWO2_02_FULL_46_8]|nr:MAG: 50S ribosomal protein L13 [Deltaproteobacteria bacterium RIFCSPLOWO2_02_FULL_46_8]